MVSYLIRVFTAAGLVLFLVAGSLFAAGVQTKAPALPATKTAVEVIAKGLVHPWGLQFLPDGRMLVTERPGRLRLVTMDGVISDPVKGVPEVVARGQGGLLDVALAADYSSSGLIFLSYAEPRAEGKNGTTIARARLVLDDQGARLEDVKTIFRQKPAWSGGYHFGSRIVVAEDGSLYVTTGDRNSARDLVQDPTTGIGKIFHITPDGIAASPVAKPEGWDPRVWSVGHRNLQGAALDPSTGKLWTTEHGARGGDELNSPEAGKNYGWPVISYGREYSGLPIGRGVKKKTGMEQPVYYWDPSIAVSGLAVYKGKLFPDWTGNLLAGALRGHIQRLVVKDGQVMGHEVVVPDLGARVRDVRVGPDGAVYVLTDSDAGKIVRISPAQN